MKKIIALSFAMLVCGVANAAKTDLCLGDTAVKKDVTSASKFIKQSFAFQCSNNVFLTYNENDVVVAVGSASKKGKNKFAGNSSGGTVTATATGCTAVCAQSDAQAATLDDGSLPSS